MSSKIARSFRLIANSVIVKLSLLITILFLSTLIIRNSLKFSNSPFSSFYPNDLTKIVENHYFLSSTECNSAVFIEPFRSDYLPSNPLYFIETANHDFLTPRQVCTIESTVRNSGRSPVLLLSSKILDVTKNNATCQLIKNFNITILHYDFSELSKDTPLNGLVNELKLSKNFVEHYSDMIRQVMIYKYGGIYLDLDFVVLKDLNKLKNSVSMTNMGRNISTVFKNNETCNGNGPSEKGHIQNAFISLDKGHRLSLEIMKNMGEKFTNKSGRAAIGPLLTTKTIRDLYNVRNLTGFKSNDLTVLPTFNFFPIGAGKAPTNLWIRTRTGLSESDWNKLFECSYGVHFYSYLTRQTPVRRDPSHEAYAFLGPKHCPLSYWSTSDF